MNKKIIPENTLTFIRKLRDSCDKRENEAKIRVEKAFKLNDSELLRTILLDYNLNAHLRFVYNYLDIAMSSLNCIVIDREESN